MTMETGLGTYVTYNPLAVSPETRVDDLLQMVESLSMHHFPVVDQEQRLIGVVSETDLILEARNRSSDKEARSFRESTTVKDIFTGHLVTVDHLASPRAALKLLMDNYVRSLPVLADEKLVAIVTTTDFLREFSYGQLTCAKEPVSDFLEPPTATLDPEATADEALAVLKNSGLEYMAAVHGGCPIGVVSGREILKTIAIDGSAQNLTGNSSILKFVRKTPVFRPGQRMSEAAALMVEHGVSALAVTNQANRLLGLVTAEQILQLMFDALKP
jgi:CBS domain-containing protein